MRILPVVAATAFASSIAITVMRDAHASCAYREPHAFKARIKSCQVVDTSAVKIKRSAERYGGLILSVDDGQNADTKVWIPEREGASCNALRAKSELRGTISFACCDGDPNPPCLLGTSNILTEVGGADPTASPPTTASSHAPPPAANGGDGDRFATPPPNAAPAPAPVASPVEPAPAPGPRNCGCRIVGHATGDVGCTIGIGVAAFLAAWRRRSNQRRHAARQGPTPQTASHSANSSRCPAE